MFSSAPGHQGGNGIGVGGSYSGDTALRAFLGQPGSLGGQAAPGQHRGSLPDGVNGFAGHAASNGGSVHSIFGNEVSRASAFLCTQVKRFPARFLAHDHPNVTANRSRWIVSSIIAVRQSAAKEAARLYDAAIQQQSLDAFLNPGWSGAFSNGGGGASGGHSVANGGLAPLSQLSGDPMQGYRSEHLLVTHDPIHDTKLDPGWFWCHHGRSGHSGAQPSRLVPASSISLQAPLSNLPEP